MPSKARLKCFQKYWLYAKITILRTYFSGPGGHGPFAHPLENWISIKRNWFEKTDTVLWWWPRFIYDAEDWSVQLLSKATCNFYACNVVSSSQQKKKPIGRSRPPPTGSVLSFSQTFHRKESTLDIGDHPWSDIRGTRKPDGFEQLLSHRK